MRHLKAGRKLGRNASHRLALMRNLARAVFTHERIITTVEKAKEARRFVEKLITLAKRNDLHARRLALARLPDPAIIAKLFTEIAPRFADRPGGYTRVIKRHERRLGDGGRTAFLELLKEGEEKTRVRAAPAPVHVKEPTEAESPPSPAAENPPAS
jgi:large subunit ribosomal protein L17